MDAAFDLGLRDGYRRWRDAKIARHPASWQDLVVEVADPRRLSDAERAALLQRCGNTNMAIYHSPVAEPDKQIPQRLAQQLGLTQLDGNWLADEDGISSITVSGGGRERGAFIPYTTRAIQWHTDGYYHPPERRIQAMLLHCVAPAPEGGCNALMDHDMAYIAVREAEPGYLHALMAPDAMTIPARLDDDGVARAAQTGPVFSLGADRRTLHMRYTARTRSIQWKDDAATRAAAQFLASLLGGAQPFLFRVRLEAGMGIVCNNVLHDRSAFVDDPRRPRLLYRARYRDRVGAACRTN